MTRRHKPKEDDLGRLRDRIDEVSAQLGLFEGDEREPLQAGDVKRLCDELGTDCLLSDEGVEHADYAVVGGHVLSFPYDLEDDEPKHVNDFVNDASEEDAVAFGVRLPNLTEDFWTGPGSPPPLYHATPSENVESILEEGLGPRCATRGISNRCVGAAVFTSSELNDLEDGSYGDAIFRIDTAAMARDGVTPELSSEPDEEEREWRENLAHRLGDEEYFWETESGMSPYTVIVHGHIPPKYLTLED